MLTGLPGAQLPLAPQLRGAAVVALLPVQRRAQLLRAPGQPCRRILAVDTEWSSIHGRPRAVASHAGA